MTRAQGSVIPWGWIILAIIAIALAVLASGCATNYAWQQTQRPSVKPWLYVTVANIDRTCRDIIGLEAVTLSRINACATWKEIGCVIYLPPNAPQWLIEHEERHCNGETH